MLKLLAAFLLAFNPIVALVGNLDFSPPTAPISQTPAVTPTPKPAHSDEPSHQLPLAGDIFLLAQWLSVFPIRNWNIPELELSAKTALVYDVEHRETLYQKNNIYEPRPIASLTKLMTALIALENAKLDDVFKVSKEAVQTEGEMGNLVVGEELTVKTLLYALLVASSNDATQVLAENIAASRPFTGGQESNLVATSTYFTALMNQKAESLNLKNTFFADASGLSPENRSSAWDLNQLVQETIKYPVLSEIMQTPVIDLRSTDGRFNHHLVNTNKLLGIMPEIIGGKTGYTQEAGNCMVAAFKSSKKGAIIIVIMESQDRIVETAALIKWTKEAYIW